MIKNYFKVANLHKIAYEDKNVDFNQYIQARTELDEIREIESIDLKARARKVEMIGTLSLYIASLSGAIFLIMLLLSHGGKAYSIIIGITSAMLTVGVVTHCLVAFYMHLWKKMLTRLFLHIPSDFADTPPKK